MSPQVTKRTRLSPEARRDQLLDTAKAIVELEGLQAFTMEALARGASVSSPLVYQYFGSRIELLGDLLEREYRCYGDQLLGELGSAKTFEDIVRISVEANFDHHAPGKILPVLLSQPDIAERVKEREKKDRRKSAKDLVQGMADSYSLTQRQAELLVSLSSGTSIAAAGYGARSRANREWTVDATVQFILAGLQSFAGDEPE